MFIDNNKSDFLIGDTSHGHFQIEMACESCHTDPFGGPEVLQDACTTCHAEELEEAHDSHPKKKFTDPREAERIEIIDARYCISCHTEHKKEQTHPMGVTLPDDYCYHCHQEVIVERESHKDLPFDSCASAGCHNYHDNRALYEAFLVENSGQAWLKEIAQLAQPNAAAQKAQAPLNIRTHAFAEKSSQHPDIASHWEASSHAEAGVDCGGCHQNSNENDKEWIVKPGLDQCAQCHKNEAQGFTSGKHGMRLSKTLRENNTSSQAISPGESHLAFKDQSLDEVHGCNSCHGAHEFNPQKAAVEGCLSCHNDEHTLAYIDSPHNTLWQKELSGEGLPGTGVSCATCHMPRTSKKVGGEMITSVDHNQNHSLRPNEKMIRPICMNCHGLEFSIDALADPNLIKNNFNGKPGIHIESVDWAVKRTNRE